MPQYRYMGIPAFHATKNQTGAFVIAGGDGANMVNRIEGNGLLAGAAFSPIKGLRDFHSP